jgi:hypothetical protein
MGSVSSMPTWTVETVEDLARLLATFNPQRPDDVCREDARKVLSHLSQRELLVSGMCGITTEEYGFQLRRGAGHWSGAYNVGRSAEMAERAVVTTRRDYEASRIVVRTIHEGPWREVHHGS